MSLFKKKKNIPALHILLDHEKQRALHPYFYYPLFDSDISVAQKWCAKNKYFMTVDHVRDGNIFYKFKPNT